MDYLSKNVRFLSQRQGFSDTEAAKATGIGQPAINKIANAKTKEAGYLTVAKLARFYGVPIDALVLSDLETDGFAGPSQPLGPDDETMAQAVELLHLMGDARPEDQRFRRLNWAMIKIAAKGIQRSEGDPRKAMAIILEEITQGE